MDNVLNERTPVFTTFITRSYPPPSPSSSDKNLLESLKVLCACSGDSELALVPPFKPNWMLYNSVVLPHECDHVMILAELADPTAFLSIGGIAAVSKEISANQV